MDSARVFAAQAPARLPIVAAIVDLDGTMIDTADDFTSALNGMLEVLHLPPIARAEVERYVGKGSEHLVRAVLEHRCDAARLRRDFDAALACYQGEYAKVNGRAACLYPDVEAGLAALRSLRIRLACVTNKPAAFAQALLEQFGLHTYFELVYGGDTFARKKPDPLPMLNACAALGVEPAATVAIGDSQNDLIAARAAGIRSWTVPYGYNHGEPVQGLDTDAIVASLLEAADLIRLSLIDPR